MIPPAATAGVVALAALPVDELALPLYFTLPLVLEAAHYVVSATSSRAFSGKAAVSLPERDAGEMVHLWRQCLADPTITTEDFITGWFASSDRKEAPKNGDDIAITLDQLQRDNVAEWLAYALYATELNALDEEQSLRLEEALAMLEERLTREQRAKWRLMPSGAPDAFAFPAGYNKEVRSFTLNLDPPSCNIKTRPLFYYALTDGLLCGLVTPVLMRKRGFTLYREGGLPYWYHPGDPEVAAAEAAAHAGAAAAAAAAEAHSSASDARPLPKELLESGRGTPADDAPVGPPPIVFVHGVGLGPMPYIGLVDEILEGARGAPMLVLELPYVSQRLSGLKDAPQEERTSQEIADACARHGIASATFVGHSLGTVYLAWLARLQPQLLASCVFIDPIVFLLHHHKVAQSFLYSRPDSRNFRGHVEHYFIKSELSIVSYFHRHFYWFANILWAHELHAPSAVVLADQDGIVPVREVERYLDAEGRPSVRKVLTLQDQTHGSFLVDGPAKAEVLATIRDAQMWGWERASSRKWDVRRLRSALSRSRRPLRWWRSPIRDAATGARRGGLRGVLLRGVEWLFRSQQPAEGEPGDAQPGLFSQRGASELQPTGKR